MLIVTQNIADNSRIYSLLVELRAYDSEMYHISGGAQALSELIYLYKKLEDMKCSSTKQE